MTAYVSLYAGNGLGAEVITKFKWLRRQKNEANCKIFLTGHLMMPSGSSLYRE